MKKSFFLMSMLLILSSCEDTNFFHVQSKVVEAQKPVDKEQLHGSWYEVARRENSYQENCVNGMVHFENLNSKLLELKAECTDKDSNKVKDVKAKLRKVSHSSGAKFQIKLHVLLPWKDIWILDTNVDMDWMIVSTEDGKYVWVISREKYLSQNQREDIESSLKAQNLLDESITFDLQ